MSYLPAVRSTLARILKSRLVLLTALIGASCLFSIHNAFARPTSPGKIPNGNEYYCGTCHESGHVFSDGSPPVPSTPVHSNWMQLPFLNTIPTKTWTPDLASQDSDGDGFTNGEELLDPNGTWVIGQPNPGIPIDVANPSDPNSVPPAPQSNGIFVHFDTPTPGKITFDLANLSAPIGLDRVEYTVNQGATMYFFSVSTSAPYTSGVWDMSLAPKGDYIVSAQLFEKRRAPGATPRSSWAVEGFAINDIHVSSTSYSVNENGGSASVTVQLAASSSQYITVDYATSNGTATAPGDYTAKSGTLSFNPGETSKTINVPIVNDSLDEPNETVNLALSNPSFVQLGAPSTTTITILDDDPQPSIRFSAANYNVNEGAGTATITVQLGSASAQAVTVHYATGDGSAAAPGDYTSKSGNLSFSPGQTSKTFNISIVNDNLDEPDETVNLTLSSPSNATLGTPANATLTIQDDDSPPDVKFSNGGYSVNEGAGTATITAQLSAASGKIVTVNYGTSNGTAIAPGDYGATSGMLTFSPGQTSRTFNISIVNDSLDEPDETVNLALSSPSNVTLGSPSSSTLTIQDNDVALPTVSISASDPSAAEVGPDSGMLTITRSGSTAALTVHYTVGGTATGGSDYAALSGTVTIPAGQTSATIAVTPVDDAVVEGNETVIVTVSADAFYTVGTPNAATVTIADDDTPIQAVTISASDPNAAEAALNPGILTITRSGSTAAALTVHYTVGGTATSGSDYAALAGTATIPAGQTSATIAVTPVDDAVVEGNETVIVTLSADPAYALGASASATIGIADNDPGAVPDHTIYLPLVMRAS